MGMVIQHNMSAMIAGNANNKNIYGLKKKTEKLSTGYKINRAADNVSGLSVSEKMRSQIRGLSQATNNSNDAISLIQTAEGGLQETENILQRMRALAVQSANGTYTDEDREQINFETEALKKEIDRISESTEYNEMKLLNGGTGMRFESGRFGTKTNEYGALYGSINEDLAIGGGKIYVTSDIAGMYLKFTTGASGKGGENAYYEDDGTGDLTQHITVNLIEGETYTDEQIQKLIDNANWPKNFETAPGRVMFKSEVGQIRAAEAETYGLLTGDQKQVIKINDTRNAGKLPAITPDRASSTGTKTVTDTKAFSLVFDTSMSEGAVSIDKASGTITAGAAARYATQAEANNAHATIRAAILSELGGGSYYGNTVNSEPDGQQYMDHRGNAVKADNKPSFSLGTCTAAPGSETEDILDDDDNVIGQNTYYKLNSGNINININKTQCIAYVPRASSYSFTLTACGGTYA